MIDFLKFRLITALVSASLMLGFVGLSIYRYQTRGQIFTYSIDFTGGTQVYFHFDEPVKSSSVNQALVAHGWESATTREFSDRDVLVRVKEYENDATGLAKEMRAVLIKSLSRDDITIEQSDTVGAGIVDMLRMNSIYAIVISLVLISMYIAFRFWSWAFAIGAGVSLFHDAIAVLLFFLLFDIEISINVIGAILTVLGYSINDTIVIFSKIRENLKSMPSTSVYTVVNNSLNQTLRRTLLTTLATTLPVAVMCIYGGEALYDLSFALLVGIVFGIYSSIYIASSIVLELHPRKLHA